MAMRLNVAGYNVVVLDNFQTSSVASRNLLNEIGVEIMECDIRDFQTDEQFDTIWNFACPASPPKYQINPIDTIDVNYRGVKNLLELCMRSGAKFVQSSTSEVYGDPNISLQNEEYRGSVNTFGPRACYDEGKRIAETLCYEFQNLGVNVIPVRIFNTYGPFMDLADGRVITNFISSLLSKSAMTIYGDGEQTRSFCYVDDLIEGIFQLHSHACFNVGPINVGNDHEFTINQLSEIIETFNADGNLERAFMPLPGDDPLQRCPDLSKIRKLIGWTPQTDLKTGISKTIKYFQSL